MIFISATTRLLDMSKPKPWKWETKSPLPEHMSYSAGVSDEAGQIYLFGGMTYPSPAGGTLGKVYIYNVDRDQFTLLVFEF